MKGSRNRPRGRIGLRPLTLLVLLLVALVPLTTAGLLSLASQRAALTARVADDLDQYADAQLARLELLTDAAVLMGELVTSRTLLRELVTEAATDPTVDTTRIQAILDDARDASDDLRAILLVRPDGTPIASTSSTMEEAAPAREHLGWSLRLADEDATVLTLRPGADEPIWLATAPMVQGTVVVAFAVLDIDPAPLLELLTLPAGAEHGSPLIRTGLCVPTDDELAQAAEDGPICIAPPMDPTEVATLVGSAAAAAVRGERILSTDVRDDSGSARVVATRPLPAHGWGLVVSVPTEELLAPVASATWTLAGLLASVGALAVAAALLFAACLTRPITALQRATVDLAAGERSVALPARAPTELEDLRRSFEAMSVAVATEQADQEDRYRDLEMLAHAMAHDLKGPLTVTRGMLELLDRDRVASEEDRREFVSRSLASTQRMQVLIDDLLTLMRAIGAPIAVEPVLLSEVVRDAVSELGLEDVTTVGPLPTIRGQRTLVDQIVLNLLHNAAAYHQPGEPVRIEISTGRRRDGLVALLIDDAGVGIPEHERLDMLETFARGTAADRSSGTGLGLPIAKRVAERHGGRIELDDAPLGGVRVRVWLPEVIPAQDQPGGAQSGAAVVKRPRCS